EGMLVVLFLHQDFGALKRRGSLKYRSNLGLFTIRNLLQKAVVFGAFPFVAQRLVRFAHRSERSRHLRFQVGQLWRKSVRMPDTRQLKKSRANGSYGCSAIDA